MHRKRHRISFGIFIFAAILITAVLACDDNFVNPPIQSQKLLACHGEIKWDTTSIRNALIGEWYFIHRHCRIGSNNFNRGSKGVVFTSDSTLIAWEYGDTTNAMWHLKSFGDTIFAIEADPFVRFAQGFVFICDDCVLLKDEITDGCCHYLRRK